MLMEFNFLYRDADLPANFIEKYQPGMDIIERGFTDTSKFRGGPVGNIRYVFLSNQCTDLSSLNDNARKWGLVLFNNGTKFTVMDVYARNGVTQVFLTTDANILTAQNLTDHAITAARRDLDELIGSPAVEILTTDGWRQRVLDPLGLDDQGEPFPENQ